MKKNVGCVDRAFRFLVGAGLLSLLFVLEGNARYIGLIGIIPILSAVMGFCPCYASTCSDKKKSCCGGVCGTDKGDEPSAEEGASEEAPESTNDDDNAA